MYGKDTIPPPLKTEAEHSHYCFLEIMGDCRRTFVKEDVHKQVDKKGGREGGEAVKHGRGGGVGMGGRPDLLQDKQRSFFYDPSVVR